MKNFTSTLAPEKRYRERVSKTAQQHFRRLLQDELVKRCQKNPRYSLRSFAQALGVSPSYLSQLLNGQRQVSEKVVRKFADKIELPPQEFHAILDASSELNQKDAPDFHQLTMDRFAIISDWYHYAILELMAVKGFQPSVARIAQSLGITSSEAKDAVERLQRLEMIEVDSRGRWKNASGNNTNIDRSVESSARKKLQRQVLEKALAALQDVPIERRDQTSITMAIHSGRLPQAIEKIKKFRREMSDFLEAGTAKDEVYNLSVSLYPLTNLKKLMKEF